MLSILVVLDRLTCVSNRTKMSIVWSIWIITLAGYYPTSMLRVAFHQIMMIIALAKVAFHSVALK